MKRDAVGRMSYTEQQRETLLAEFERSGLKGAQFALAAGVKYQTFAHWVQQRRQMVRLRVRYFTDGVVLGSKEFVDGIFAAQRERFSPKRREGARRISESAEHFHALRRLRLRPLG